jgi:hypothetical protein
MEVVSFKLQFLYPGVKIPRHSLDRRLDGHQLRSGRCGEDRNILPLERIEPRTVLPIARRYTDSAIMVEGRIILERNIKKADYEDVGWIQLVEDSSSSRIP